MRKILLFAFLLFSSFQLAADEPKRAEICLNMIVKNESKVIRRCLESVKPLIDYWVIVDTGSTDGTQQIIKDFMKEIPGELHERPWVNFAHNRNEALLLAKKKANYLLFIDADDMLEISKSFVKPLLDKDCYHLKILYGGSTYYRPQLIKTSCDWKWGGVVHEAIYCELPTTMGKLDGVNMLIVGGGDRSADPKKFEKDAKILEKALKEDPNNARNVFYLAQSYRDAEKPELALKNYEKRVAMGGWEEEVFISLYRIAELHESLNMPEETVAKSYLKAFSFRPTRAEPLYKLSSYYRQKDNHLLAYLLADYALKIKQPDDFLFVESWIYDYGILFEYSISSYWVGKYYESLEAISQLLAMPNLPQHIVECIHRNKEFVIPKVAQEGRKLLKKAS